MKLKRSLEGGLAGALALTLVHEVVRRKIKGAPRMDLLGMEAVSKIINSRNTKTLSRDQLFALTFAGDVLGNTIYYSLSGVGRKKGNTLRGMMLGLAAGITAIVLPKHMGLNNAPSNRTTATKIMTAGLYLTGGLVTAVALNLLQGNREDKINN